MNISELCIRRPVLTTLMTASLIVFGAFAYRLLPVAALPAVDFPTISMIRDAAGRKPGDDGGFGRVSDRAAAFDHRRHLVDDLVVVARHAPRSPSSSISTATSTAPRSTCRPRLSIAARRLPIEMTTPPSFRKVNPGDFPVLFISLRSRHAAAVEGQRICRDRARAADFATAGRRAGPVYGAQKFAVRVQVDPVAAAARNISLDDIRTVVAKTNSSAPVGTLTGPNQNVTLLATSAIEQPPNIATSSSPIATARRSSSNEIARVIDSVENDKIATWFNDARAIVLAIQRQPDANTVEVVDRGARELPTLRAQVPPSIELRDAARPLDLDPRRRCSTCRRRWRSPSAS